MGILVSSGAHALEIKNVLEVIFDPFNKFWSILMVFAVRKSKKVTPPIVIRDIN